MACRQDGTAKSTLGAISASMAAEPPTFADLREAGIISSREIVAAIDVYVRDPSAGPYRFASGHSLDIAAIVNARPALASMRRSGPHENAFRIALARAIMVAQPTEP